MIHQLELPDLTRKRLTDIVMLQLRLLKYAARRKKLTPLGCAKCLNESRRFRGRGDEIAEWLWHGPERLRLLTDFSAGATSAIKLQWVQELSEDVIKLLHRSQPVGDLHTQKPVNAPDWQNCGADFLRKFYLDWYYRGFPVCFFSEETEAPFTRQDFIEAFVQTNDALYVCAACDVSPYTSGPEDNLKSSIDHYFPKETYPHLVMHPFNLVPGCSFCNSAKATNDMIGRPGNRRDLRDVILPYREPGLGKVAYLQTGFKAAMLKVKIGHLKPLRSFDVQSRIDAFGEVFNIPNRWGGAVDQISETLFRKMKQSCRANRISATAPGRLALILEKMLDDFRNENLGREAHMFAMSCWLEKILKQTVQPVVKGTAGPAAKKRLQSIQQELSVRRPPR